MTTKTYHTADGSRIEYTLRNGRYSTTTHVGGYAKVSQHITQAYAWDAVKKFIVAHGGVR